MNRFLIELIENGLLDQEEPSNQSAQVNKLRCEITELKKRNLELEKRNQDLLAAAKTTQSHLHKPTLVYLNRNGIIKSPRNVPGQWAIVDSITGKYVHLDHMPDENDIKEFKRGLGYTSIRISSIEDNVVTVQPSDKAGATDIVGEIESQYFRAVRDTIEQLEELGLVVCGRGGGYKWKR